LHRRIAVFLKSEQVAKLKGARVNYAHRHWKGSPPAWSTRLEARRHREDNVSRIFLKRSTVSGKFVKPLLKEDQRKKRRWRDPDISSSWLFLSPRNRGVYFLHMYSCGKINATFVFFSLCLCVSSRSRRVVNPSSPFQERLRLPHMPLGERGPSNDFPCCLLSGVGLSPMGRQCTKTCICWCFRGVCKIVIFDFSRFPRNATSRFCHPIPLFWRAKLAEPFST